MKRIIFTIALLIGIIGLSACSSGGSDVVVKSKSGNITEDDLYKAMKKDHGEATLQPLIEKIVLLDKYEVSDKEVAREMDTLKADFGDDFEKALEENNIEEKELEDEIRLQIAKEKAVTEDIEIKDKEIEARYERMKEEFDAQHILVEDEDTAKKIIKKLDDGDEFDKLAAEYSVDTETSENGGNLGYFSTGVMDEKFENALYDMKKDEISEPVNSDFGFHVIKVLDRRDVKDLDPLKDMKVDIERSLAIEQLDPVEVEEKIDKLLEDAEIDIQDEDLKDALKKDEQMMFE